MTKAKRHSIRSKAKEAVTPADNVISAAHRFGIAPRGPSPSPTPTPKLSRLSSRSWRRRTFAACSTRPTTNCRSALRGMAPGRA
jgi:hypothetical protein